MFTRFHKTYDSARSMGSRAREDSSCWQEGQEVPRCYECGEMAAFHIHQRIDRLHLIEHAVYNQYIENRCRDVCESCIVDYPLEDWEPDFHWWRGS